MTTDMPDLTPRPADPMPSRRRRRIGPILVLVAVVGFGGWVLTNLRTAVDYYCNVDEVGVRDGCDADRRLRLQGTVAEGSVVASTTRTEFDIEFEGVSVAVRYAGEPGGIFNECIPVVVHGVFDSDTEVFLGDRVEVKHSDEYVSVNDERLTAAEESACSPSA